MILNDYRLPIEEIDQNRVNVYAGGVWKSTKFDELPKIKNIDAIGYLDHRHQQVITRNYRTHRITYALPQVSQYNPPVHETTEQVSAIFHQQGITPAVNLLIAYNALAGENRCYGQLTTTIDGVPTFTYCNRPKCKRCRGQYHDVLRQRIVLGALQIASKSELWFITLHHQHQTDTTTPESKRDYLQKANKIVDNMRKNAKSNGVKFEYVHVIGFKPTTQEIHSHILCNYVAGDIVHAPTKARDLHYRSNWLENHAIKYGLTAFIEKPKSVIAVAKYSAKNLKKSRNVRLPKKWQAVRFSKNWIGVTEEDEPPPVRKMLDKHIGDGELIASFGGETDRINRAFAMSVIHAGGSLYTVKGNEVFQLIGGGVMLKSCKGCGERKPKTLDYFHSGGNGKLVSRCKDCERKRDRKRGTEPRRRMQKSVNNANSRSKELGIVGELCLEDMLSKLHAQNCKCKYCGIDISTDFEIDHVIALSNGGKNTHNNVVLSCSECNRRKNISTPVDFAKYLAQHGIKCDYLPDMIPVQKRFTFTREK